MYKSIPLLILIFLFSCVKEDNCGESYTLDSPAQIDEGETLTLTVAGFNNEINTYFAYDCPDMTPYNSTGPGGVSGGETFTIEDFNIQDEGTYTVTVFPGGDACESFTLSKTVTMIPKTCPCSVPAQDNTLYYSPSYEGQFTEDVLTPFVYNSNSFETSTITFNGQNTFKVFFGRMLPESSSTFTIIGGHNTFWDDFDDDYLDVHFHINGSNHGFDFFRIEENKEMYLTRTANQLIMQFCDLEVSQYYTGIYSFTLSGKFVVDL
jgi:hypothetical protein